MNVFELVKQAQEQTAAKLRPGVTAKEVDETSREVLNNAGIGNHFVYTGVHSTGVIEFEAPILASKSDVVIEKNMVYSIDIPIFITEWGGMRLENGYLITENGPEPLNDLDTSYCIKQNESEKTLTPSRKQRLFVCQELFIVSICIEFAFTLCNCDTCNGVTYTVQRSNKHFDRTVNCKN